jgi:hypothetical protein
MNPMIFESLNKIQLSVFLSLLKTDFEALAAERPGHKTRIFILRAVKHIINKYTPFIDQLDASRKVGMFLYNILKLPNAYPTCFAIMSSRTRL